MEGFLPDIRPVRCREEEKEAWIGVPEHSLTELDDHSTEDETQRFREAHSP
jgi:hypothetical protein